MNKLLHFKFFAETWRSSCSLYSHSPLHNDNLLKNARLRAILFVLKCLISLGICVCNIWERQQVQHSTHIYFHPIYNIYAIATHLKLHLKYHDYWFFPTDGTSCWSQSSRSSRLIWNVSILEQYPLICALICDLCSILQILHVIHECCSRSPPTSVSGPGR
jgi:hypothetical protein